MCRGARNPLKKPGKLLGLIFLYNVLMHPVLSQNQTIEFEHLTSQNGLPNITILDIIQDKKEFMWFASRNGLFRYDGYNFTVFKTEVLNKQSISDNWISALFEDSEGILYAGTWDQGLNIFSNKNENFTRYKTNNGNYSIASDKIRCIREDSKGLIWIGTADKGFISYNKKAGKFTSFSLPEDCPNNCIDMVIDRNDNIWMINSVLELLKYDPVSNEFKIINKSFAIIPNTDEILSKLLLDKNGNLWIGTNLNGLFFYDTTTMTTRHWVNVPNRPGSLNYNIITDILEASDGKIWIAEDGGGIDIYDTGNDTFEHHVKDESDPGSLSTNAIYCLHQDNKSRVWAGTYLGGINIFNPERKIFSSYNPVSGNRKNGGSISVLSFLEDKDGDLLIGTDGNGLHVYNKEKYGEKFINVPVDGKSTKGGCPEVIKSMCQTSDGSIWMGTWNKGLVKFDKKNNNFTYLGWDKENKEKISCPTVWSIMEDDNQLIWVGVWPFGIDIYDWKNNKVVRHINQSDGFRGRYPGQIIKDSKGRIWIPTYDEGINLYSEISHSFTNFRYNSNKPNSLSCNQVSTVFEDGKGNIWVGTLGGGLNFYNEKTGDFSPVQTKDEPISDEVAGILEDSAGNLWISSNKGIFKFSPSGKKVKKYDINDGLQANEFNDYATLKARDGRFFFGGIKGFNAFYPDQIKDNPHHSPLYITSFSVFNKPVTVNASDSLLKQSIIETKQITLPYYLSVFTFEFTAINFNSSKKNQYAYRMENFEDNWNMVGNKRYATYTNLDPGAYVFMVRATNNDGVWNETPTRIKIIITPPYWKTWWFRITLILLIIGAVVFIFIWRTNRLKMQKKELEIKVRERTIDLEDANTKLEERQEEILIQREELQSTLDRLSQAQEQLIQSEKMASLGVLTAGVSHEINNPLNFIMGGYMGLEKYFSENRHLDDEQIPILLNSIRTGVDRAINIVNGLNQFSRNNEVYSEECDIHSILNNCLFMLNNQLNNRIEIKLNYTDSIAKVSGNAGKLHQVFLNILNNSYQAIPDKGLISIRTFTEKDLLLIEISDTGIGISREHLTKIMDPFFTTKDPGKGTGLGLSIVYRIIQDHNGIIEFQSEINEGMTVKITLPKLA
jgi:signal transduction histidine kinase/ligand-binding sensor domain-containing protein